MTPSAVVSGETTVLRLLLARLMAARPDRLALNDFDRRQQTAISATFFLLDGQPRHNTERFVTYTLGQLIEQLGRETERPYTTTMGQVRGQINWQATHKARYSDDYNPGRFICREVRRDYDTPQNQLLKFVVERIYEAMQAVPREVRQGVCYFPAQPDAAMLPGPAMAFATATAARLDRMEAALNRARLHAGYRAIVEPQALTADHTRAAALAREEAFGEALATLDRYQALHHGSGRTKALAAAGRWVLPLPSQSEGPGALWLGLAVAILRGELAEEHTSP